MFKVSLKTYNVKWAAKFKEEAQKIMKSLEKNIVSILHIGSTSIDDMTANEVIDIAICVNSLEYLKQYKQKLANLLYLDIGYFNQENWFIFGKYNDKFHLHLGPYDNEDIVNLLLFKLYLSKHADYKEFYIDLKKKLLKNSEESFYEFNKRHFVVKVILLAKLEYLNGGITESDFEIIYKNGIINDKEKMIKGIKRVCQADEEKLKDEIPRYKELHSKMIDETEEAMRKSPFCCKFTITSGDGNPVEMNEKEERMLKTMMSNTMVRQYLMAQDADHKGLK
jgi:GrpB-like predicted nucleotidyltransferase (UPF0157 family)